MQAGADGHGREAAAAATALEAAKLLRRAKSGLELAGLGAAVGVSREFPSCSRSTLTEIYLCHACSCHAIEDENA
eukprot:COSAG01_NODE_33474_length_563_cov_1.372845_2_plen_74_part_01